MNNKKTIFLLLILSFLALIFAQEKKEYTLPEIVSISLENNPLLIAKFKEAEAKKVAYQASRRLSNPELEIQKGRAKSHDGLEKRDTKGFSINQYLENPFKRHYRIQIYKNDWQSTEQLYHFFKLEMIFEIKNLFYKTLLLEENEQLAQKNLDSITEIHKLIEKRVKLGEVKELEAIKLYVEKLRGHNELQIIQTELKLAKENLNKSLAYSLPPDYSIQGKLWYAPLVFKEESLVTKTLLSYPLIKGKEKEMERAENNIRFIKWQRLPDFELSGFHHDELDGRNTGIGISLDIPLWNFKSKEIAEAESIYWKQREELRALQMEVSTEVKSKLNRLLLSEQKIKLFHEGLLNQAEQSLKISEISYTQGEISLIDYLDSQRIHYSILRDYQESLYAWNADKAALEKAIGEDLK